MMGENEETKKKHAIFGSAGMAAAGMMSRVRLRRGSVEESEEPLEEPSQPDPPSSPGENAIQDSRPRDSTETPPDPSEHTGWKAAVIGETGAGNFGHGMDLVFQRLDGVRLFGLTDLNSSALEDSRAHAGATAGYETLSAMLEEESPGLVSIASSSTRDRKGHLQEVLQAGAHAFCEAPLARTLKEGDEILELEKTSGRTIAVRYPMRLDPAVAKFRENRESLIGTLVEIRAWGACDGTAGGEDLLLVGVPLFDLVRWFAGDPNYCTASILKEGIAAIAEDAHESQANDLGPLLGDTIHAEFEMESGVRVSFSSAPNLPSTLGPAGLEFVGTKSRMRLFAGARPVLSYLTNPTPDAVEKQDDWKMWPEPAQDALSFLDSPESLDAANRLLARNWIDAISGETNLVASARNALKALEMAHGIWQAGVTMKRAYFPLANRLHPLSEESQ